MIEEVGFNNSKTKLRYYSREKTTSLESILKHLKYANNLYNSKQGINDIIIQLKQANNVLKKNSEKYIYLLEETERAYNRVLRENAKEFDKLGDSNK